ncbi:hypothetical protein BKA70DRAFT_608878 [Coprinopsis sp. MPI-PUGE-AT-0042]|nr:hypothetical protein BKA70DRAFT_608878 [Coprinopsis sp. MPI-PUGE-AT-0042]
MPSLSRGLPPNLGFATKMRVQGFIFMGSLGLENLLMRRHRPPRNVPGGFPARRSSNPHYRGSCFITFLDVHTSLAYISLNVPWAGTSNDFRPIHGSRQPELGWPS